MSEILVVGDSDVSKAIIKTLIKNYGDGVIDSEQSEPLTKEQMPKDYFKVPKKDNSWRGGSRGKGGKVKWARK